jgi:ribonuclease HIII
MEFYDSIKNILLSNSFKINSCKLIDFGLQFNFSQYEIDGLIRIYQNRKGIFKIDYSQIKNQEILDKVQKLLENRSLDTNFIPQFSDQIDNKYYLGYPIIGTDESGKGDYFGPLVSAAVYVDENIADKLRLIGVRDSKECSDKEIAEISKKIIQLCAGKFEVIEISPEKYNRFYNQLKNERKNLNTMLAWGHAKAIEELLQKVDSKTAISDQFADERFILGKLQEKGKTIKLVQMHKAEHNIAVAAASILARARFLDKMAKLSKKYKMTLPRGASDSVINAGKQFIFKYGLLELNLVAKMHFKTTLEILKKEN